MDEHLGDDLSAASSFDAAPSASPAAGAPLPPPGWYPDPSGQPTLRYWDGAAWAQLLEPTPGQPAKKSHRKAISIVVAAVLVLGVGGVVLVKALDEHHDSTPTASAAPVSSGTKVSGKGVSLILPPGWTNIPTSPAEFQAFMAKVKLDNPQLAAKFADLLKNSAARESLMMFGLKTATVGTAAVTNVNVAVFDRGGAVADSSALDPIRSQIQSIGATNVTVALTSVNGSPAVVSTYDTPSMDGGIVAKGAQYYVLGPTKIAVVTVTSGTADPRPTAAELAATVTFD